MKFAVLTQRDDSFALIQACFSADGIVCEYINRETALFGFSPSPEYALLLIDAQYFNVGETLIAWCKAHVNGPSKIIVFGCFPDRASMSDVFNSGVSDVLVGAIDSNEMYVRTRRVFKYAGKIQEDLQQAASISLTVGAYVLCKNEKQLTCNGTPVVLNQREFAMAWLFFSAPGTFFSKQKLAEEIWGGADGCNDRTIERYITALRKKLGFEKNSAIRLRTIYSLGYKLEVSPA